MKIVVKNIADLHKPAKNIRKHTPKQLKEYVRSIEMFGQIKPIVIDEGGEIIAGNGLYEALISCGRTECDCYVVEGLTEAEKKKLMLADNKIYDLGITDMDAFDDILKELDNDTDVPGYDPDLLDMLLSSVKETTDIVNSYGTYEPGAVNALEKKTVAEHVEAEEPPKPYQPMPAPAEPAQPIVQNIPAAPALENAQPVGKYVICPRCGEKIWL